MPKLQTSLAVENFCEVRPSGAVHRTGMMPEVLRWAHMQTAGAGLNITAYVCYHLQWGKQERALIETCQMTLSDASY